MWIDRGNENLEHAARLFKIIKEFGNDFYLYVMANIPNFIWRRDQF